MDDAHSVRAGDNVAPRAPGASKALPRAPMRIRLTLDDGLAAYIRAYAAGIGIAGNERDTIIFLLRGAMTKSFRGGIAEAMMPYLPEDIQAAWGGSWPGARAQANPPQQPNARHP